VQLGPLDSAPPNAINPATVGVSAFPNRIELQWQGVPDDPNGTGILWYQVYRHDSAHPTDQLITWSPTPSLSDPNVVPGTTYTYSLQPVDFHWNPTNTTITVNTPG